MRCSACGSDNRDDRRFCRECGAALAVTCATCGAANDPGDRFCGACGAGLGEAAATSTAAPRTGSERRMASILFADIVGFTPLSESRDPEEVRELLGRYFETSREIVERYGGMLEKFIGDAVVAVWGAPQAQEDDAERAVRTALELVSAVRELGTAAGVELALRAGVSTGGVAVTLGAEGQGMVAGDVVNTTARIQTAAQPGSVLVDEATRRVTEAAIAYASAGSFELKGKAGPVELWTAQRVVAARRGEGRSRGLEPPFVGRARELSLLKQLLHATAEDGRAHIVSVTGIAGIGKSRLAWEFEKYLDGLVDEFLWHRGRCLSYGDGVAFWALAEIVRGRCRIVEDEAGETAEAKLDAVLAQYMTDAEADSVREPLRQLLGLSRDPDGDRNRLFPAWRLFIERLADTSPVMLLIEDLHWADNALLDFIDYLVEWSRHLPLFVLTLSRPELAERRPGWGAGARALTSLALEPLSREEMLELVDGMAHGAPPELIERVADAAEGVPLYAVETVRMLLDRGLLVRDGDELVASGDLTTLEIPETLHALVAARLDALPEPERRLIEDAAVLGKAFTLSGLTAVSGLPETELEPLVASLVRREVLVLQVDPFSPERGQYEFVQALVRTIAYETIGRRDRKRRHRAAAEHLETLGGEELAEVIAAHYVDAYRLAPDDEDAGQLRETAARTLVRAAERARSLAAAGEAARLLAVAIELTEDQAERARLLEQAGRLTIADGRPGDSIAILEGADELLRELGDMHGAARLRARQGEALFLEGRTDEAVELMEPAYGVLRDQEQDADLAALASQYARMLGFVGRMEDATEPLERSIDIAERLGLGDTLSHALNTKGISSVVGERPQEARTLLDGALRVALEVGDHEAALRAYFNLSFEGQTTDQLGRGDDDRGLELARRIGDRNWERAFLMHQSHDLFRLGRWDESVAAAELVLEGAVDTFSLGTLGFPMAPLFAYRGREAESEDAMARSGLRRDSPDGQNQATWAAAESLRLMALGRWAEGADAASAWQAAFDTTGLRHPSARAARMHQAECLFRIGELDGARRFVGDAGALPPGLRTPYLDAHSRRLAALLGDVEDPAAELALAAETFRRIGYRFDLLLALTDAAEVLAAIDPAAAEAAHSEALEIAGDLGATAISARLGTIGTSQAAAEG